MDRIEEILKSISQQLELILTEVSRFVLWSLAFQPIVGTPW